MNSMILMAEIVQEPQLRYTSDNQTPIAEMQVQFPGPREEDPMTTLKVVGWGNLAQEIQQQFHVGDRVIIEGRLGMIQVDRPEGFKEKRAELTVSRIHRMSADATLTTATSAPAAVSAPQPAAVPAAAAPARSSKAKAAPEPAAARVAASDPADYDDIPF